MGDSSDAALKLAEALSDHFARGARVIRQLVYENKEQKTQWQRFRAQRDQARAERDTAHARIAELEAVLREAVDLAHTSAPKLHANCDYTKLPPTHTCWWGRAMDLLEGKS